MTTDGSRPPLVSRDVLQVVLTLLAVGLLSLWLRVPSDPWWIGTTDGAAYANQARSLVDGDTLYVRYISSFYYAYDPQIWRPDDHWPPGMALVLAPFFAVFGSTVWSAKVAAISVAVLWLPLCVAALAGAISRRPTPALLAGLLTQFNTEFARATLEPYSDLWLASLTAGLLACILVGGRWLWLAGIFGGLMWWTKGSGLIALLLIPLFSTFVRGRSAWTDKRTWQSLGLMLLVMTPLVALQVGHYGTMRSTQSHVAGFFGVKNWAHRHYHPYWGQDLPSLRDRFRNPALPDRVRTNAVAFSAMSTLGLRTRTGLEKVDAAGERFNKAEVKASEITWATALVNLPGLLLLITMLIQGLPGMLRSVREGRRWSHIEAATAMGAVYLLMQASTYVLLWGVMPRLVYPSMVVLSGVSLGLLGDRLGRRALPILAVGGLLATPVLTEVVLDRSSIRDVKPDRNQPIVDAARWFDTHGGEHPVVMSRGPWQVLFYTDHRVRAVALPFTDSAETLLGIAWYYGVDYLVDRQGSGAMRTLSQFEGVVHQPPDAPSMVWKIDWSKVPIATLPHQDEDVRKSYPFGASP